MSTRLDEMISGARELDAAWDITRSERVREGALRRRDVRVRRGRALHRGLLVAGGAGLMVLGLLRAASSAPAEPAAMAPVVVVVPAAPAAPAALPEALAVRAMSDAGYARD